MFSLTLGVLLFVLWRSVNRLKRQVVLLENRLALVERLEQATDLLTRRVATLEQVAPAATAPTVEFSGFPPAPVPVETPPVVPPHAAPNHEWRPSTLAPAPAVPPIPDSAPVPVAAAVVEPAVASVADVPETWEVVVGTNWLNKIGVLIFVTGLALLLGYSMTHVGPLGRVAMGLAVGTTTLLAGVAIERRPVYQAYGRGLVAGGWAGIYVTAYAMRALPAAQVIESNLTAGLLLLLVASGMVTHSLRYRSQTVTALAYIAAYVPLGLSPLSTFSLIAACPLAVSLLVVAARFGWSNISLLGLASTYGLFALRAAIPSDDPLDSRTVPYLLLAVYWPTFEIADIAAARLSRDSSQPTPLFATNAIGAMGCLLLLTPSGDPDATALVLATASIACLGSAIARARLVGRGTVGAAEGHARFTTAHMALALAAGFGAWAIGLRFEGPRLVIALLLEAELVITSGVSLGDRQIRRIGTAVAVLVSTAPLFAVPDTWAPNAAWPWFSYRLTPTIMLMAGCWYLNREWLRRRALPIDPIEHLYSWVASLGLGFVITIEVPETYVGLTLLAFAIALVVAGTERAAEYRRQSYFALAGGALLVAGRLLGGFVGAEARDIWRVLPAAIALSYGHAWWMHRRGSTTSASERQLAIGVAATVGLALLTGFEWQVVPATWLGLTWAITGCTLVGLGLWRTNAGARWQGYVLGALAVLNEFTRIELSQMGLIVTPMRMLTTTALMVYAFAYAMAHFGRSWRGPHAGTRGQGERVALIALPALATAGVLALENAWFSPALLPAIWSLTASTLLATGWGARTLDIRVQSYLIFSAAVARALALVALGPVVGSTVWMAAVAAMLYGASLASKLPLRRETESQAWSASAEEVIRLGWAVAATALVTLLVAKRGSSNLVTMGWGLEGTALLTVGFAARERALRLAGLALLFLCILKLFVYDLRELEALGRIISFVVLGLVLLGVSWTYTRYKEQIRKLL